MRYIDRRFLFPVAAATAFAQQQSPQAAAAEAALRARVEQFFQLQVDKKYRQGASMVADDSKDAYYDSKKFNIKNFAIQSIELTDNNTKARVTIKAKVTMTIPAMGPVDFDAPTPTLWKIEKGQWCYYTDTTQGVQTPFGFIKAQQGGAPNGPAASQIQAPSPADLASLVKVDRTRLELTRGGAPEKVVVSNGLPGGVDVEISPASREGMKVNIEKKHLEAGEKTSIDFSATSNAPAVNQVFNIVVSPLGIQLPVVVSMK